MNDETVSPTDRSEHSPEHVSEPLAAQLKAGKLHQLLDEWYDLEQERIRRQKDILRRLVYHLVER